MVFLFPNSADNIVEDALDIATDYLTRFCSLPDEDSYKLLGECSKALLLNGNESQINRFKDMLQEKLTTHKQVASHIQKILTYIDNLQIELLTLPRNSVYNII